MAAGTAPAIYEFEVDEDRGDVPTLDFLLNGQTFTVQLPKIGVATSLLMVLDDEQTKMEFTKETMRLIRTFMLYILEEPGVEPDAYPSMLRGKKNPQAGLPNPNAGKIRGRARLMQRINDPKDKFDLTDLVKPMISVLEAMFDDRPTGPLPASIARRRSTSRGSGDSTRSTTGKTSGTRTRRSS